MGKEIVVDINPYQTRVVLMDNGSPSEIYIEQRGKERLVGNIYKGRVQNVLPGMQAAFVDVGLERNAFLYAGDVLPDSSDFQFSEAPELHQEMPNIKDIVKPGQEILVQVLKEPVGTKGVRVTTHITLPGRTLVLMPMVNYIGVSRRIEDERERARLKETISKVKPDNMGVIVRTAALDKSIEEFEADMRFLTRLWERIQKKSQMLTAPRLIHGEEPLVFRTIRDLFTPDIDRLTINDREFYEKVQVVAGIISPALKDRVVLQEELPDRFDTLGLEGAIDKALCRKVWIKNGAYIIIDQTEALTTIDVNTGKYVGTDNLQETITATNCEAAKEIARQLRLRDISGIIIIDFIDMDELGDKEKVIETLKEELRKDRTKSNVLGITQLGLVEMTRKKSRKCISNVLQTTCPYCNGSGRVISAETMLLKVRKKIMRSFATESCTGYLLQVHPDIAKMIYENTTESAPILPREQGRSIWIQQDSTLHIQEFHLTPITSSDELKSIKSLAKLY